MECSTSSPRIVGVVLTVPEGWISCLFLASSDGGFCPFPDALDARFSGGPSVVEAVKPLADQS